MKDLNVCRIILVASIVLNILNIALQVYGTFFRGNDDDDQEEEE